MTKTNLLDVENTKFESGSFFPAIHKDLLHARLMEKLISDYLHEPDPQKRAEILSEIIIIKEYN